MTTRCLRVLFALLIVWQFSHHPASAQVTDSAERSSIEVKDDENSSDLQQTSELTDEQKEKKRQLEIGMILVGGILILGVFLLVLTLLSSRRLKRSIAAGREASQPRDELWYLKNAPDSSSTNEEKTAE